MVLRLTVFLSICVTVLMLGSNVYARSDDVKIHQLPPKLISEYIKKNEGQRRIIMIYASWCPHCIKKLPKIMDMAYVKPDSVIAISVDENYKNFARYIKKFKKIPFRVILNKGSDWELAQRLKEFGVEEWDGIPYIVFLDEHNNAVGQDNYGVDEIADYLFKGKY